MAVNRLAQIGRDPLAEPAHGIEARGGKHTQRHRHQEQRTKVLPQRHGLVSPICGDQPGVNQIAQCQRKRQRGQCCHHQAEQGPCNARSVGVKEGQQPGQ